MRLKSTCRSESCAGQWQFECSWSVFAALVEFTEADEALADQALLGDVFLFMKEGILGCETFGQEEFYVRRLHSLITDFLALMPMKVRHKRFDEDKSRTFLARG